MDGDSRGPAEPKKTYGDAEGADEGGLEPQFGLDVAILVEFRFHVFIHVPEEGRDCEKGTEQYAKESETLRPLGKSVDADKDNREAFEPQI